MGFQRDDIPLVRSRADSPCRVWDSVPEGAKAKESPSKSKSRNGQRRERGIEKLFQY